MKSDGDEPGLVLLFITEADFLNESASTIGQRALLAGLSKFGIASQVICGSDQVASEPVALATNFANEGAHSRAPGGQLAPLAADFPTDRSSDNAAHEDRPKPVGDGSANELVALVAAALDRQRADLVVIQSGTNSAQILAACRTRDVPTVVIWEGSDPRDARLLGGASAILASSQAMADYLREAFGLPAVLMLPLVLAPDESAGATASHIVFDGSMPGSGLYVFAQIAAEIDRRRPNTPVTILGPDGIVESSTGSFVQSGADETGRAATRSPQEIWEQARVLVAPLLDWQRTPHAALTAMSYGVPTLVPDREPVAAWFGEGALALPLPSRLIGAAPLAVDPTEVATWVETVLRLYDDPAFAARQRCLALASVQRFSPETLVPEYAHFFEQLARKHSRRLAPTNGQLPVEELLSRAGRLAADYPWPSQRPPGIKIDENLSGPCAEADPLLARALSGKTRLVVELGACLGSSTRSIVQHAPHAIVVSVDQWLGSPEQQGDSRFQEMLPQLYATFLSRCWEWRERIIPLRRDTPSGLNRVADARLQPDVVYFNGQRSLETVLTELRLARQLFPHAALIGNDYACPPMRQAVDRFAKEAAMIVSRHPAHGWQLLEKWQIAEAGQPPPGRAQSCVLVPHLNGIDWECEQGLRHLEAAGVRVVRRGGCSAIDVARNEMLSEALHDAAEAILFIDSDIGFDPQDALNLLARPEEVVAAIYAKKSHREMASVFADGVQQVMFGADASGLYPLKFAATGFLRIRAHVLRRMIDELRLPLCNTHWGRGVWPFFLPKIVPHGSGELHYLGEDWAFSDRLAEIGVTPLADTSIRLWHWGRYGFGWEDAGRDVSRYANYLYDFAPRPPQQA